MPAGSGNWCLQSWPAKKKTQDFCLIFGKYRARPKIERALFYPFLSRKRKNGLSEDGGRKGLH